MREIPWLAPSWPGQGLLYSMLGDFKMTIKEALDSLHPWINKQWTADGLPRLDLVQRRTGDAGITREDITAADPTFYQIEAQQRPFRLPAVLKRERALHTRLIAACDYIKDPCIRMQVLLRMKTIVLAHQSCTDEEQQSRFAESNFIRTKLNETLGDLEEAAR